LADEGRRVLAEEDGILRDGNAALGCVVLVVEADADDLVRIVDRGEKLRVGDGNLERFRPLGGVLSCLKAGGTPFEDLPYEWRAAGRHARIDGMDIDELMADENGSTRTGPGTNGSQTHDDSERLAVILAQPLEEAELVTQNPLEDKGLIAIYRLGRRSRKTP